MIKPESNAPSPMKPWVRTTDKQIEDLQSSVAKIESVVNSTSTNIDHELNQGLANTFDFTPLEDGTTEATAGSIKFTGAITSESDISLAGSFVVGDPSRQEYDPTTGDAIASIPNLEVIAGKPEINPVTEIEYYTTGQLNTTDTAFSLNGYGTINGDGMQITLSNNGELERQNIEILGATGNGTDETFQITNNASNVAVYVAGKYVNISGVDPAGYNGNNLLITSVNTGVSPMTFTVAGTESGTYVGGGYVTINQPNSIYEGKLSVQGPAPDFTGTTISQGGVFVGADGGDPAVAVAKLDETGLTAPSAFIDQAVINGTRLFISDTPPTAVNDGDIWIDKIGIFTQGDGTVNGPLTFGTLGLTATSGTSPWNGSSTATIDIDITKVPRLASENTFTAALNSGSGTYDGYNTNSTIRAEFRGTAGTHRPYIELQGVGANDVTNENGGAFIRFRTSRSAGYGADIGAVRKAGGASQLIFKTGVATVDAISQKMAIDENGNVLINGFGTGTVGLTLRSPANHTVNMFEIQDELSNTYASISRFGTTRLGGSVMTGGRLMVAAGGSLVGIQVRDGGGGANIQEWQNGSGTILNSVNGSGGMLIGTTHLAGATAGLGQIRTSSDTGLNYVDTTANDAPSTGPGYTARRTRGTLASPTQVQANDLLFGIFAQGYHNGAGFSGNAAAIRLLANQNFTTTATGSSIVFETAADGSTGRLERMRVTGAGTLSVGTTSSLAQLGVVSSSTTTIGQVIRAQANPTADIQQWQNSLGSAHLRVTPIGDIAGNIINGSYPVTFNMMTGHNPEGKLTANPMLINDLAYARLRGSTFTWTGLTPNTTEIDSMFNASSSFWNIAAGSFPATQVIQFTSPVTLTYGAFFGISFGNAGWAVRDITLEAFSEGVWKTVNSTTSNNSEVFMGAIPTNAGIGTTQFRITLATPLGAAVRITHIFAYNFASPLAKQIYLGRDGGTMFGDVYGSGSTIGFAFGRFGSDINWTDNTALRATARDAGNRSLVVRGFGTGGTYTQTANLQEWQSWNGTTSTILARVDSGGNLKASNVASLNSLAQIAEANSGGLIVLGRATAQSSSPGLNAGSLYFRDGTTSGTLRLATRTGVAGVEETIVDNISSTGSTAGAQFTGAGGVRTTGLINTNGSQYGNNIVFSAPASTTYYLLATLPTSSGGTYDHLRIDATYGTWTDGQNSTSTFIFSNRNAFFWRHYLSGHGTLGNIKVRAYSLTNGSVEIWASGEASQFMKFAYNISSSLQVTTVANPVPTTTVPTGTVVFDSSNVTTYPPVENQHGGLNLISTSDTNIPFKVTGTTGQTGDLVQFFRGTTYSGAIERGGAFNIQPSQTNNGYALFVRGGASTGIIVRSGGGAIQQWQNSSNQQVGLIAANGGILLGNTSIADNNYISLIAAGGGANGTSGIRWGDNATGSNWFSLAADTTTGTITLASSVDRAFRVRGSNGQTANLQEWQTFNGTTATTVASVASNGSLTAPSLTISSGGTYGTGSIYADANWGMIFRARTASPVNAQYRWANSVDGELMRLDNSGRLIVSNGLAGGVQGTAQIEARTVNATTVGLIIRGFGTGGSSTQSANLQEWQSFNGTTPTTLASISSFGSLTISSSLNINGSNSPIVLNGSMGSFGQVLTSNGTASTPIWTTLPASLTNPMTTAGDIIYGGASGAPTKLAGSATNDWVLTYDTSLAAPKWAVAPDTNTTYTFASGTTNGAFSVTPLGGSAQSVSIFGLGTSAYVNVPVTGNAAATEVVLGSDTRLTDARTPLSHTHGNISNAGVVSAAVTATNPVKVIIADSGNAVGQLTTSGASNTTFLRGDGTWATPAGGGSFTGGTLTSDLILAAGSATVEPLTFQTNSATPTTTSGAMDYDGVVFYQTANTNPGRALSTQDYYYLSNSQYFMDLSTASVPRSLLGANTRGITVAAGTTYDYEAMFAISASFILTSQTPTLAITSSTVSGSPSVSHFTILETGNNTAGFGTAITLGTTRITTTQNLTALTTGNRYYIIKMRGRINVTGTGTTKLYPSIQVNNGSADNGWTVETGAMFKLTPLGNGTVTQVGAWA